MIIGLTIYTLGLLATGRYVTLIPDYRRRERLAPSSTALALVVIMILWPFYWALVMLLTLRT